MFHPVETDSFLSDFSKNMQKLKYWVDMHTIFFFKISILSEYFRIKKSGWSLFIHNLILVCLEKGRFRQGEIHYVGYDKSKKSDFSAHFDRLRQGEI